MNPIDLADRGVLPDWAIRAGIRRLLAARLSHERKRNAAGPKGFLRQFVEELRASPVAVSTGAANQQHYEVPVDFFLQTLGPRLKYSCCYWPRSDTTLSQAENAMLELFCNRARIEDGMEILELGCGWGSLCLWIARTFPRCNILAVSNSQTQRAFIESRASDLQLPNVQVVAADVSGFATNRRFDRVLSVEMFEHIRNYEELLRRIAIWLTPEGRLLVHIFCHVKYAYPFETEGVSNWMGRHFFTGGIMPSDDLLHYFQRDLVLEDQWRISGIHYSRTLESWLANCDRNRRALLSLFQMHRGRREAERDLRRWRIFFMACSELFNYRGGREWYVAHYLFRK